MFRIARFAAIASAAILLGAGPADDGRWLAGGFSFSDELGGFRILDISGAGTRGDPVLLTQELYSASAVVLVIRDLGGEVPGDRSAGTLLHLELRTVNASGFAWVEFAHELQEERGEPSIYSDGLSFDQTRRGAGGTVTSDAFALYDRDFEPYDRLLFRDGKVDPEETATFLLLITDLTPVMEFYLVQDPRIPFS